LILSAAKCGTLILLYLVAAPSLGAWILIRQLPPGARPTGDFLSQIDLPFWWWPFILGPPTLLIAFYFRQRSRSSRAKRGRS
jgi:hypothetical protein